VVPPTVKEPFLEIAKNALRRKAATRWSAAQIAERLNPNALAAKAAAGAATSATATSSAPAVVTPGATTGATPQAASMAQVASGTSPAVPPRVSQPVEPISVPLSKEPAVPLAKQPKAAMPPIHVTAPSPRRAERSAFVLPNYALPVFLVALILVGAIALPKILRNRTVPESSASSAPAAVASKPANDAVKTAAPVETPAPTASASSKPAAREDAKNIVPPPTKPAGEPAAAPAVMRTTESTATAKTRNSSDAQGRGEVLDQELPQVPAKALSTISGTVRVVVKAHVDAAGQVAAAELQEPGPSRYFADKATQAAQRWVFNSPEVNGRSVESDWLIRFEYTRDGVKAIPQQVSP